MTRLFLDVDGVLADFTMGAHKKLGIDLDYKAWPYAKGPKGWDWNKELGISFDDLSAICDFDFWANLPWCADGHDILRAILTQFKKEQITLLTTPMNHVMSPSGKWAWIEKNLPEFKWQTLVSCSPKQILATVTNSVLVDDCQKNVDEWRAAGGHAVLIPRPYNNNMNYTTMAAFVVLTELLKFKTKFDPTTLLWMKQCGMKG